MDRCHNILKVPEWVFVAKGLNLALRQVQNDYLSRLINRTNRIIGDSKGPSLNMFYL